MNGLAIAYAVQFVVFGLSYMLKMAVDPDMNMADGKSRQKYARAFWTKAATTAVVIFVVWWFWYPLQNFLNIDFGNLLEQNRPK
jgi:Na+-driven multidrug efflux pump